MLKNKFTFAKGNALSAIIALAIVSLVVLGCGGSKPEMPSDATVQSLVKGTMSDFADAVDKGDYSSFRDKASKDFQATFTADQLKTLFKDFSDHKDVVSPILHKAADMTPKFSTPPSIREEKGYYILVTDGQFDTTPVPTKFTYEYEWQDNSWKLLKTTVKLQ